VSIQWEYRDSRGRRVSQREWLKSLERDANKAVADSVEAAIPRVRCPVHGGYPSNVRKTQMMGSHMEWQWDACCEAQEQAVRRAIS
jgi:hypothetical protein